MKVIIGVEQVKNKTEENPVVRLLDLDTDEQSSANLNNLKPNEVVGIVNRQSRKRVIEFPVELCGLLKNVEIVDAYSELSNEGAYDNYYDTPDGFIDIRETSNIFMVLWVMLTDPSIFLKSDEAFFRYRVPIDNVDDMHDACFYYELTLKISDYATFSQCLREYAVRHDIIKETEHNLRAGAEGRFNTSKIDFFN